MESLPETRGRFALNTALPIAFDGSGTLESISSARTRVSPWNWMVRSIWRIPSPIDGTVAGNQLLQENGYFVLRFLADDVGKELDAVLDGVSRALSRRRN